MSTYMPYNHSINKNLLDWKRYDFGVPTINSRNLFNFQVNTTDLTMMGTDHSSESTGYVTSRY